MRRKSAHKTWEIKAHGDSMAPLISNDAMLVLDPSAPHTYKDGEVVAYVGYKGRIVVHRILRRMPGSPTRLLLKGDHNYGADRVIEARQVLGKVRLIRYPSFVIDMDSPAAPVLGRCISLLGRMTLKYPSFRYLGQRVIAVLSHICMRFSVSNPR